MKSSRALWAMALVSSAGLAGVAAAQTLPKLGGGSVPGDQPVPATWPSHETGFALDSGPVAHDGSVDGPMVVFSRVVSVPDAVWLRLKFDVVELSGDPAADGAYLRITSIADGGSQRLNAEHAAQWMNTSAYLNGEHVLLEVVAFPGTGPCRVAMSTVTVGDPPVTPRSICGSTDDRTLLNDNRTARHSIGCTSWLIDDLNTQFLTAGHCGTTGSHVMMFNVPLSNGNGSLVNPPPEDQYAVDGSSVQGVNGGVGNDWGYFGVFANSNTGLMPFQVYGVRYQLANAPSSGTPTIRITGYGTTSSPVPGSWNQTGKTHTGPYAGLSITNVRYTVDTTGGNSGSPVFNENNQRAIGIHTHAGCGSGGGYNNGTARQNSGLSNALNNPLGICASGAAPVSGPVFVAGDQANNFGTANTANGGFGKVSLQPASAQSMAYNRNIGKFYVVDLDRKLYTADPGSGAFVLLGTITGVSVNLNGLAYDPVGDVLYTLAQSNGQLYTVNKTTLAATAVGSPGGGTVGALEWDTKHGGLYGINDAGGSKFITINTATGAQSLVGALGAGATDCNGLAYVQSEDAFYTIDAATEQLLRVNRLTGAATVVGSTGGRFGTAFGMSAVNACPSDINGDSFVTGEDFDEYVAAFEAGAGSADFDGNGFVNGEDFDAFAIAFAGGC